MEHALYLCDLSFYSSSMVGDSLVASDKMGAVHMVAPCMNTVSVDHFKKDIKFYPTDDLCFTTTDMFRGIRVWDRSRGDVVYSYKEDSIKMHTYNKMGCLAAVGEGCVKLYDLRVRYNIDAVPLKMCRKAEWGDNRVYCINDECVAEYDTRNMSSMACEEKSEVQLKKKDIGGILDFASISRGEFCTVKRGGTTYLVRMDGLEVMEGTRRTSVGDRMIKIKDASDDFVIGALGGSTVGFYEYKDTWTYELDGFGHVDWMCFGRNGVYVFAGRKTYFIEGGYERFKELAKRDPDAAGE
ncbi:WD repeat containing protein [Encephalitozoon cuniculi GB-M1]|uniref:WD repeat containing protein n=1 Tax=Encephalitozoon cuniculi (strain GB-M1) TaxID=284813 RepID=Q8SUN3_ENCCU|nr:uncharacterized protein ECU08_1240 [Encephalitozoon cuniculi GB-M1]CAD26430.1 WD repeat containing protein [Encephalitozoon cuniculi GB-M1]